MNNRSIADYNDTNERLRAPDQAGIWAASVGLNYEARVVTIDLTSVRLDTDPYLISFPFKSLAVLSATDSNVSINVKLSTQDTYQDGIPLKKGTSFVLPQPTNKAFLNWTAQVGKTITLLLMVSGEFRSNILDLVNSGSITVSEGTSFTTAVVALTAATATQLFPANTTRKTGTWVNDTGSDVWLGNASVSSSGVNKGMRVAPGASFTYRNTSALYAFSVGGSATEVIFEEM